MNFVRFSLKRTIISVLCLATVFGSVYCANAFKPSEAKATTIGEYEQFIKDLEAEQKELENEIKRLKGDKADQKALRTALRKKIDNTQSQINACNKQISDLDNQIVQLESDIVTKTQELEDSKYAFRQRLRAVYMSGGEASSSLSVLLSADGLEDLLTKSELTKSISAYDGLLMQKIVNDMKAIEEKKAQINVLIEEQKATKATLAKKKAELDSQIAEVNSIIAGIDNDIGDINDKVDALEKAQREYEQAIKDAQHIGSDQTYSGDFAWPCPGYYTITSPYGYRNHPISGKWKFHKGVDISGGGIKGKPIIAAADGIVSVASYNSGGYGYYVMVNHGSKNGDSYITLYAHMTRYVVSPGQSVKKGQTIGYVGTSGSSTGYHLHFEVRVNGNTTNPMSYFN